MELIFTCPSCGVQMQIEGRYAGRDAECPECGKPISIPPLQIGPNAVLGGFRLERKLGSGSMGDVYLAEQIAMKRKVALKILPASMTRDPQAVQRFLHEVQTLARFEHPNIVTAFDAGSDEGTYYLAMSYVNGEDLDHIVKREGPMAEKRALEMIQKVAAALKFAWQEHQLLHRDIKPENMMIDVHGQVRLMDMGISKSAHEDSSLTMPGVVFGTPHYMSPEQAWSEGPIDFRADLYSLGASLYRLVVGEPPYVGASQVVFAKLAKPDPFPLPRAVKPELSEGIDHLIDVMMAPKPEQRYASWEACLADFDRVLAGKLPTAPRPLRGGASTAPAAAATAEPGGLLSAGHAVIQPKDTSDKRKHKLSMHRTEQMEAPGTPPAAAAGTPVETAPPPPAEASIAPHAALPSEVSAASKPASKLRRTVAQTALIVGVTVLVLGTCFGVYVWLNPDANPFKGGTKPPPAKVTQTPPRPGTTAPTPATATTPVIARPTPPTPVPPRPTPNTAAGPTFEELRKKVQTELNQATLALKLDEAALAKKANLPYPAQPPKMAPDQIAKRAAELAKLHADKTQPLDQLRAKVQQDAKEVYGAYLLGQEIFLLLRGGMGANAQVKGILRDVSPTSIRVGERTIPVADLSDGDRDRLDGAKAQRNMEAYIRRKMEPIEANYQEALKKALDGYTLAGYQQTGYVKQGEKWVTQEVALKGVLDRARQAEVTKLRQQIEQRVFGGAGYKLVNGKWLK